MIKLFRAIKNLFKSSAQRELETYMLTVEAGIQYLEKLRKENVNDPHLYETTSKVIQSGKELFVAMSKQKGATPEVIASVFTFMEMVNREVKHIQIHKIKFNPGQTDDEIKSFFKNLGIEVQVVNVSSLNTKKTERILN